MPDLCRSETHQIDQGQCRSAGLEPSTPTAGTRGFSQWQFCVGSRPAAATAAFHYQERRS